ncbi:MAG: hypothetical protein LIO54_08395 [Oscillospiraceae bacterium]|nr:hypothetical protein [Oscillospiraceae bacterium]
MENKKIKEADRYWEKARARVLDMADYMACDIQIEEHDDSWLFDLYQGGNHEPTDEELMNEIYLKAGIMRFYSEVIEQLDYQGKNTEEIKTVFQSFKDAKTKEETDSRFNQLCGFLSGLVSLGWMTADNKDEVIYEMELGNL